MVKALENTNSDMLEVREMRNKRTSKNSQQIMNQMPPINNMINLGYDSM